MANFTAKEFEALQVRARTVLGDLVNSLHAVQDECSRMSEVVASGDSSLSSAWASVASSLQKPIATTENNFNEIDNMMTTYATETIAGEEKATSEMEKINEEISALNTEGEQLVDFSNIGSKENIQNPPNSDDSLIWKDWPTESKTPDFYGITKDYEHDKLANTLNAESNIHSYPKFDPSEYQHPGSHGGHDF